MTEVYNEIKSLKKSVFKEVVVKPDSKDMIWKELKTEMKLRDGLTVIPLAKL